MKKKPGHCFENPGFDPCHPACARCLEYVRTRCAERKRRMQGVAASEGPSEVGNALAASAEFNERFMDKLGGAFRGMVRMGKNIKQVTFFANGRTAVFVAYNRVTGRMKVSTAKRPEGRMFNLKSAEEADALAAETMAEA